MRLRLTMTARVPRHRWQSQPEWMADHAICKRCGLQRYDVEGAPATINYEWPDGRKKAVPKNGPRGYVPPCEGGP